MEVVFAGVSFVAYLSIHFFSVMAVKEVYTASFKTYL